MLLIRTPVLSNELFKGVKPDLGGADLEPPYGAWMELLPMVQELFPVAMATATVM